MNTIKNLALKIYTELNLNDSLFFDDMEINRQSLYVSIAQLINANETNGIIKFKTKKEGTGFRIFRVL